MEANEVIEAFKEFEQRAHSANSTQMDRIKEDRDFLGGNQWDSDDDGLIDKCRCRRTINVLSNSINAVSNQYSEYPFVWYTGDEELDGACNSFLNTRQNARAPKDALYSSVSFGIGYIVLGTETIEETTVPCIYTLPNICDVIFDPDSIDIDGADATQGAIVEMRSKDWIKVNYGEDFVTSKGVKPVVDISGGHDDNTMPIITYFKMENGEVWMYKLLNNDFCEEPQVLPISRIPIFPVYGERSWNDDKVIWQGLVRKGKAVQKMINYGYTQLGERLAQAPKPTFMTTVEAVEGLDSGYKNYSRNLNPLLLYNRTTEDGKTVLEKPERMDNSVRFEDVNGIISSNLELLSSITGVDAKGVIDTNSQLTATEVLYNERNVQTNIKHYYDNLRDTFKSVGETVLEFLGVKGVSVDVIQGPGERMQKQIARQELTQLAGVVDPQYKGAIVDGILMSNGDNAILRNVYGIIHSIPKQSETEKQAMITVEEMKKAIQERDAKLAEMQKTIEFYEKSNADQDKGLRAQFLQAQQKQNFDLEKMAFQAQLDAGADAGAKQAELAKQSMELEKQAIQLDTAKVKANAEMMKNMPSMSSLTIVKGV